MEDRTGFRGSESEGNPNKHDQQREPQCPELGPSRLGAYDAAEVLLLAGPKLRPGPDAESVAVVLGGRPDPVLDEVGVGRGGRRQPGVSPPASWGAWTGAGSG